MNEQDFSAKDLVADYQGMASGYVEKEMDAELKGNFVW